MTINKPVAWILDHTHAKHWQGIDRCSMHALRLANELQIPLFVDGVKGV